MFYWKLNITNNIKEIKNFIKEKLSLIVITSTFLLFTIGFVQTVDAVNYAIYDQKSCESLGGVWDLNRCQLISMTVNENDIFIIDGISVLILQTLDNFGKIIITNGNLINGGGNITNHDGGYIINKENGVTVNHLGKFYNEGIIKNESTGIISNNKKGIFTNTKTGVIFNDRGSHLSNMGVFYNNNIIFNFGATLSNIGSHSASSEELGEQALSRTNFTDAFGIFNNQDGGIIFNKHGTIVLSKKSELNNGDQGIIFIDTGSSIINLATIKNSNKFFIDCGGFLIDYKSIDGLVIEIPCTYNR